MTALLKIDESYDRERASDGVSRYGSYVRDRAHRFRVWDDEPTTDVGEFAALAFEIACSPIMSPPYLLAHPRVVHIGQHRDDDDRRAVVVRLALDLPADLARTLPAWAQGWDHGVRRGDQWWEPWDNRWLVAVPALTVRVPFPPADRLPGACYDELGYPHVPTAQTAVRVLVAHVNTELASLADLVVGRWT